MTSKTHTSVKNETLINHLDHLDLVRMRHHFSYQLFGSAPELYSSDASYAF